MFGAFVGWPQAESFRESHFQVVIREPPTQTIYTEAEALLGVPIEVEPLGPLPGGIRFAGFDLWLDSKLGFACVGQEDGFFAGALRARFCCIQTVPRIGICNKLPQVVFVARYLGSTRRRHAHHYSRALRSYMPGGAGLARTPWCPELLQCGRIGCQTELPRDPRKGGCAVSVDDAHLDATTGRYDSLLLSEPVPPPPRDEVRSSPPLADGCAPARFKKKTNAVYSECLTSRTLSYV